MAAPTRAPIAPIAPATGAFLKAAPVAEERVVEAVPLAATEVEGPEVPGAGVPVPLETVETMGGETVSIQGRAGNKAKGKHRTSSTVYYIRSFDSFRRLVRAVCFHLSTGTHVISSDVKLR